MESWRDCSGGSVDRHGFGHGRHGGLFGYHGYLDSPEFIAEQGHDMGRAGAVQVRVHGEREAIEAVQIGGTGVVVLEGGLRENL